MVRFGLGFGSAPTEAAAVADIFINEECDQKSNEVLIVPIERKTEGESERERSKDILSIPVGLIKTASLLDTSTYREREREPEQ